MALGGLIQRPDKKPLGTPEEVKAELLRVFPDTRFSLVQDPDLARPRELNGLTLFWGFLRLLERMRGIRYPQWEGNFEAREFAAAFQFNAEPVVTDARITLYGGSTASASADLDKLFEQTGWKTKF